MMFTQLALDWKFDPAATVLIYTKLTTRDNHNITQQSTRKEAEVIYLIGHLRDTRDGPSMMSESIDRQSH